MEKQQTVEKEYEKMNKNKLSKMETPVSMKKYLRKWEHNGEYFG